MVSSERVTLDKTSIRKLEEGKKRFQDEKREKRRGRTLLSYFLLFTFDLFSLQSIFFSPPPLGSVPLAFVYLKNWMNGRWWQEDSGERREKQGKKIEKEENREDCGWKKVPMSKWCRERERERELIEKNKEKERRQEKENYRRVGDKWKEKSVDGPTVFSAHLFFLVIFSLLSLPFYPFPLLFLSSSCLYLFHVPTFFVDKDMRMKRAQLYVIPS